MKRIMIIIAVAIMELCTFAGCRDNSCGENGNNMDSGYLKELYLCVGDTYDFYASGFILDGCEGDTVMANGNIVTVNSAGESVVTATNLSTAEDVKIKIKSYPDGLSLGDRYNVDKGMFRGKKIIVFGDSITDGCLLDPDTADGFNYKDTYYAKLCEYLGAANDPTDLVNSNFACGATTMTYVPVGPPAISGVERVAAKDVFYDNGRKRNPAGNIADADLCIIFYGTNDFGYSVPLQSNGLDGLTDFPQKPTEAKTIKGGLYYMITTLRKVNPFLKFLVLPPLYRRANADNFVLTEDLDVMNIDINVTLSDYRDAIRDVCESYGAKFIDWSGIFNYENFGKEGVSDYSADGLHPNVAGHKLMYDFLISKFSSDSTLV